MTQSIGTELPEQILTILHSERPKLHTILAFLSAKRLKRSLIWVNYFPFNHKVSDTCSQIVKFSHLSFQVPKSRQQKLQLQFRKKLVQATGISYWKITDKRVNNVDPNEAAYPGRCCLQIQLFPFWHFLKAYVLRYLQWNLWKATTATKLDRYYQGIS